MSTISDEKKQLLNEFFNLYMLCTDKQFRDKISLYNPETEISFSKTKRIQLENNTTEVRFGLDIKHTNSYKSELYFIVYPDHKLNLKKRNCTCPHALSGKLCEHITVSLSYIFDAIKKDEDIAHLFLHFKSDKPKPVTNDIHSLLHTMTKRELINFIYSLEDDEEIFKNIELRLQSFFSEES